MSTLRSGMPLSMLAALALGSACVSQGELRGPPFDVMVLDRVDGGSSFALQRRQLQTVTDFERLSAPTFAIRQGGTLRIEERGGDVVTSGVFEGSRDPNLRYVVQNGAAVPRDYSTLLMFSAAYQFERVLEGLSAVTDPSTRAALESRGALEAIFEPIIEADMGGVTESLRKRTNAFFFPSSWQFGLAGSSAWERAPLAADARVLAHELGHSVFQQAFFRGSPPECDPRATSENELDPQFEGRWDTELAISGLNEGFADWISFAVTGGTDPLQVLDIQENPALDRNVNSRIMTEDTFRWTQIWKLDDSENETRCQGEYCVGTLFARSLVATFLGSGRDAEDDAARQDFSRTVVSALEGALAALEQADAPLPEQAVASCEGRDEVSLEHDPGVIGAFLQAFLHGMPAETKPVLCRELIDRFEDGFPVEYRKECEP
jgi:hypothetical protein